VPREEEVDYGEVANGYSRLFNLSKLSVCWLRLGITIERIKPGHQGLPELDYPFHDKTINVTSCGRICLHRKKINLSTVFAGQAVGIKEVEEGIWLVSFMDLISVTSIWRKKLATPR
jgi:hypothetical protein